MALFYNPNADTPTFTYLNEVYKCDEVIPYKKGFVIKLCVDSEQITKIVNAYDKHTVGSFLYQSETHSVVAIELTITMSSYVHIELYLHKKP